MRFFLLIVLMLTFVSINTFSQIRENSDFELIYAPSESLDSLFEFNGVWETKSGDFVVTFMMGTADQKAQNHQRDAKEHGKVGLLKVSKKGVPCQRVFMGGDDLYSIKLQYVETESHGSFAFETSKLKNTDLAMLRVRKLNDDLEILSTRQYFTVVDTVVAGPYSFSGKFFAYQAFESKDVNGNSDGIWACAIKSVHDNSDMNDTLFFFKFDYEGNMIDKKSHELSGSGSHWAFYNNNIIVEDAQGYSLVSSVRTEQNLGGRFTWLKFDRDFNFVKEYPQPGNNLYVYNDNTSIKMLSSGDVYISSTIYRASDGKMGAAITLVDTTFRIKRNVFYPYASNSSMIHVIFYGSTSFVNESMIFWGINDGINFSANPYWVDDTWIRFFTLTSDLDIKEEYYYDIKGSDSYTIGYEIKATSDGGLVLIGDYSNFTYQPERVESFITKFPAEAFLGIEEAHNHGLKLAVAYPNPGNVALNIRTALQDAVVEVYDVQGRKVAEQAIGGIITTLDTESWPSGMYLWNVLQDGKVSETGKWVKE